MVLSIHYTHRVVHKYKGIIALCSPAVEQTISVHYIDHVILNDDSSIYFSSFKHTYFTYTYYVTFESPL